MDTDFDYDLIQINNKEFELISKLIYDKVGINLTIHKKSLIVARLNKIMKNLSFDNFEDYYYYVIKDETGRALVDMVDKISTNHTYFFREKDHFDFLTDHILPQIKTESVKIWSSACATGEEPYTLAMVLDNFYGKSNHHLFKILATDISVTALTKAKIGDFSYDKVYSIDPIYKHKYFYPLDTFNNTFKITFRQTLGIKEQKKEHFAINI